MLVVRQISRKKIAGDRGQPSRIFFSPWSLMYCCGRLFIHLVFFPSLLAYIPGWHSSVKRRYVSAIAAPFSQSLAYKVRERAPARALENQPCLARKLRCRWVTGRYLVHSPRYSTVRYCSCVAEYCRLSGIWADRKGKGPKSWQTFFHRLGGPF